MEDNKQRSLEKKISNDDVAMFNKRRIWKKQYRDEQKEQVEIHEYPNIHHIVFWKMPSIHHKMPSLHVNYVDE